MSNRNRKKVKRKIDKDLEFKIINGATGEVTVKHVVANVDNDISNQNDINISIDAEPVENTVEVQAEPVYEDYPEPIDSKFDRIWNYSIFCLLCLMSPPLGGVFAWFHRHRALKHDEFDDTYKPMKIIGTIFTVLYIGTLLFLYYLKVKGVIEWDF